MILSEFTRKTKIHILPSPFLSQPLCAHEIFLQLYEEFYPLDQIGRKNKNPKCK